MIEELIFLIKVLFTKQRNTLEILEMQYFPFKGFSAMSWCGYIITRNKSRLSAVTLNHERIHLDQALQFKSWIHYYLTYLWYCIKTLSYRNNPFEVEAYQNQFNCNYKVKNWRK